MNSVHYLRDAIAVVGWACRLPGAKSVTELWSLLLEGRCTVSRVPSDRFSLERFGHPRRQERGKSYSWAAGVIDDLWGFDPSVFGISPREAEQMDPQQRILLQLTWEALEDAGIRPSSIAGSDVGVFVGGSQTDYGHLFFADHAIADSHFATGTALSILANRISYIYDLRGPSVTVDTACSSSLVALHHAVEALRTGRIDTAIVGGINVIASPASFIAFSQAAMLSPTGLCQAFAAKADGFVRGEGGTVLVLRKAGHAQVNRNPIHGFVLATDVNSDGRTNGISLPSAEAQEALLSRVYSRAGINPDRLAFVEAHGTGTPAGDPIEANALGRSLGRERSHPLPIGSIKTNIGHLEPASGLAGMLKALLALNHGILPPSLHFSEPNPNIEFERLNLAVCGQSLLLPDAADRCAGVNSFGFGGTNAHAIVAAGRKPVAPTVGIEGSRGGFFAFSAETKSALVALARSYGERLSGLSDEDTATLASAVAYRREHLSNRIVVSTSSTQPVVEALKSYEAGSDHPHLTSGCAVGYDIPVAFVYSGNGSQWVGMGLSAYRHNARFRAQFEQVDSHFQQIAGWSLRDALFGDTLRDRLPLTSVAQPLIFAIQSAATAALRERGLRPATVLGHSVGEVAAAEAAGILDLRTAIKVIHFRSTHQELVRGAGRMAAVLAPAEVVERLASAVAGVEITAFNSPRAVTVAGPADALAAFKSLVHDRGIALIDLDLDYPFHTSLMAEIQPGLTADLKDIVPRDADVPFVSSVTGACLPGSRLTGAYWWRNAREQVQFMGAVRAAAKVGARYFVEIGPRSTLLKHVADSLEGVVNGFATLSVLDRGDGEVDPFDQALAKAVVGGARVDLASVFGVDPGAAIALPAYPWQQQRFRYAPTAEAIGVQTVRHPFAGVRHADDALEWHAHIDTSLFADLVDHKVGEQTIFPGAGFLEVALSVARQWLETEKVVIANFEILKPLDLTNGETRDVMTRVSPGSNTLEIYSRPRLSQVPWLLHCRGKMFRGNAAPCESTPEHPKIGRRMSGAAVYEIAESSGLHYGPAFRLVSNATVHSGDLISVELVPSHAPSPFLLDPMRLDCCAQGVLTAFPQLRAAERGVTYIPVQLEESALFRAHDAPQRALIEILSMSERSILANYHIYGSDDEPVAVLRGLRSQAVPFRRSPPIETTGLVEVARLLDGTITGNTGVAATAGDIMAESRRLGLVPGAAVSPHEATLLIEGWATAVAYEIASGLADGAPVNVDRLVASGRLPEELGPWLANILENLGAAGLARREGGSWALAEVSSLPSSATVVKALAKEHPDRAAEVLLAGAITGFAEQISSMQAVVTPPDGVLSKSALDFYDSTSVENAELNAVPLKLMLGVEGLWSPDRAIRVLLVGFAPLAEWLASRRHAKDVLLTIFEPDRRRYERLEHGLSNSGDVTLIGPEHDTRLGTYDLVVSVAGLHRLPSGIGLAELRATLAPGGLLLAVEPRPSLFKDIVFGLERSWFGSGSSDVVAGSLRSFDRWKRMFAHAGFDRFETTLVDCGSDIAELIVAEAEQAPVSSQSRDRAVGEGEQRTVLFVAPPGECALAAKLIALAGSHGLAVSSVADPSVFPDLAPDIIVFIPSDTGDRPDPAEALTMRCMEIKACAEKIGTAKAVLWLLFSGALGVEGSTVRPLESGAWAFSRTLANEFHNLDVRRIDVATHLAADLAAEQIRTVILSGTDETEIHLDGIAIRAVRVVPLKNTLERVAAPPAAAAKLVRRTAPGGQRLSWQPIERTSPGAREVEITVGRTGLNFRDLMWSLSLLPDDMLDDGAIGPTLGLECSGFVSQVGSSITHLKVGDPVLAFAVAAFSTHVTVPATQVAKLPAGTSCEAAATIPVAFLTTYYSLVTLAKLRRGEWVLIHGGAGAVGMAAIQIAQWRGAQIIVTAGSRAKRALLEALGVRHVFDSRSTTFVDDVSRVTGSGVDVVLNSLAGEAMERSVACLRPFGRFVELGKRDYVTNAHIGLRPFRKNLSYFGVDAYQLIVGRNNLGARVYSQIMRQFENGTFTPLPYSVFPASGVSEAFHMMQQSSHIGKILVRPPEPGAIRAVGKPFAITAQGTHVVTGGLGGFGLATAKWLVERGARHLVLIGRSGAATEEAKSVVQEFAARGVTVVADPCDVADLRAVEKLFAKLRATMPDVVGVIHAAMVLDDTIIANLDADRFKHVFGPKVTGAENLDLVTRALPLEYFVLFSSVTTLFGNPGQGNYVAANAYLEGLARRRRQLGLRAVAIGWGPITDVGVLARNERVHGGVQKVAGVSGMRAREALDLMANVLEQPPDCSDLAAMTLSPSDGSFGSDRLPVLRSPTYAGFVRRDHGHSDSGKIDLRALARSEGRDAVRRKVMDVVVAQLARVLRSREEDISRVRPLGEIGLDSLMALELVMNLGDCFGIHVSLAGSAGALNIAGLADEIIAHVDSEPVIEDVVATALAGQHLKTVEIGQVEALKGMMGEQANKAKRVLG
jgi:phthiocerol/phenolphthiocerol synthesis type-I polyketide synthase C